MKLPTTIRLFLLAARHCATTDVRSVSRMLCHVLRPRPKARRAVASTRGRNTGRRRPQAQEALAHDSQSRSVGSFPRLGLVRLRLSASLARIHAAYAFENLDCMKPGTPSTSPAPQQRVPSPSHSCCPLLTLSTYPAIPPLLNHIASRPLACPALSPSFPLVYNGAVSLAPLLPYT